MNTKMESLRNEFANNLEMSKEDFDELAKQIESETTAKERSILKKLLDCIFNKGSA